MRRTGETSQNTICKQAPFLKLLIPLVAGILLQYNLPVRPGFTIMVFCLSFVLFIFYNCVPGPSFFFGLEWMHGLLIQIIFISFGRLLMFVHQDKQIEISSGIHKTQSNYLVLQILNDPVRKQKSFKCLGQIRWLINQQNCFKENEKILVYFNKKSRQPTVSAGALIILRKELQPIENIKSSEFDYKKYCRLKHIYAQIFLNDDEFLQIRQENKQSFLPTLDSLRKKILAIIKDQVPGKSEDGLLEALLVGFTEDLDPAIVKSYADTGVIHIIAISGLHLALICHILQFMLKRAGRKKSGRWIKLVVITSFLWFYSLLSGASPSVTRSAAMFTLILFGRNILRETSLFNILSASAFLLLSFDPFWILDTGFQLSYAAVLGLGLFSKPLRDMIPLRNKSLDAIWNAASVSIAAQILTTPISIYYFHRFPVYFLVANLLAVPLSSLILTGGILLCMLAPADPLASSTGLALGLLIRFLNGFIQYVSSLPGAVLGPLSLNIPRLILIYLVIFCFYHFMKSKEKMGVHKFSWHWHLSIRKPHTADFAVKTDYSKFAAPSQ
jgi:competence protein ComEC